MGKVYVSKWCMIHDAINGGKHIGLVISPLKSLMIDQRKQTKHVFAVYK
jgi:superfamily II DNA helicase RecQ